MKVFQHNIKKQPNTIMSRKKLGKFIGKMKYLPSYSKEWNNLVYSYNSNKLSNMPINDININKIINSYFALFYKDSKDIGLKPMFLRKRRRLLRRIHVSNAEIQHTNDKAIITLYVINREKSDLKRKFKKLYESLIIHLLSTYKLILKNNLSILYNSLNEYKDKYFFIKEVVTKQKFIKYKLDYLNKFIKLKQIYSKKIFYILLEKYLTTYLKLWKTYNFLYSINKFKFDQMTFLPNLNNVLKEILNKNVEYNIINLKNIVFNADIFTNVLALKLKIAKQLNLGDDMGKIIKRARFPKDTIANRIKERTLLKGKGRKNLDNFLDKYRDLKLIPNLSSSLEKNLRSIHHSKKNNDTEIRDKIYNFIHHKNIIGIRLEASGRLTKRYRADRAIHISRWKGGMKNIESSFQGLSSVLYRGNTRTNLSYSLSTSKRRVGAFAIKGWINAK